MQKHVLLIENNPLLAKTIADQLPNCTTAETITAAIKQMEKIKPQMKPQAIIIGNNDTPNSDYERLRQLAPQTFIIHTGDSPKDCTDAHLGKPYHIRQLLSLLASHRTSHLHQKPVFTIGDVRFQTSERTMQRAQQSPIFLTDKEAEVLEYLCHHAGGLVTRQQLLQHIWGYQHNTDTHTLETYIYRLRQKLGEDGNLLATQDGGYILTANRQDENG